MYFILSNRFLSNFNNRIRGNSTVFIIGKYIKVDIITEIVIIKTK